MGNVNIIENDGLATAQTMSAPLNAFPYRSRGAMIMSFIHKTGFIVKTKPKRG